MLSFRSELRLRVVLAVCVAVLASIVPARGDQQCERLVSLAPSVTEVLFDLGLGDRIVGATDFCRYPPEALALPRVGGYLNLNVERIVMHKPSMVFGLVESELALRPLRSFPLSIELVDHRSVEGIKASYRTIAAKCGVDERAQERLAVFADRERALRERCAVSRRGAAPLRVMVVVGRTRDGNADSGVYISGSDGFYSDVISLLGAVNVHSEGTVPVPTVSVEGMVSLAPDVIVDVVNIDDTPHLDSFRSFWKRFPMLPAVRQGHVLVVGDDFASIPGPRYIVLAERLAQRLCRAR